MSKNIDFGIKSFENVSKAFSTSALSCPGSGKQLEKLRKIYEMMQNILK